MTNKASFLTSIFSILISFKSYFHAFFCSSHDFLALLLKCFRVSQRLFEDLEQRREQRRIGRVENCPVYTWKMDSHLDALIGLKTRSVLRHSDGHGNIVFVWKGHLWSFLLSKAKFH